MNSIAMRIVTNAVSSNDFFIRVDTEEKKDTVAEWIARVLSTVFVSGVEVTWYIVSKKCASGRVDVLARFHPHEQLPTSEDGLIITDFSPFVAKLSPDVLRGAFFVRSIVPPKVNSMGISGVPQHIMARLWWHVIGGSKGLWRYPMLFNTTKIGDISETFNWKSYPPTDNPDGELRYS